MRMAAAEVAAAAPAGDEGRGEVDIFFFFLMREASLEEREGKVKVWW